MTNNEEAQGGLTNPPLGNQSTPIPQTDLTDQLDLTDLDLTDSTDYRPTSVLVDSNPFQIPHIINNLDGIPVPFRQLHCIDEWRSYAEPWVLQWIEHGIPLPWRGVPHTPPPRPQDDRLRDIIKDYLAKGILEEAAEDQQAIQHIFAVPKNSGGYRAVTDFRPANEVQDDPHHFKMTTVQGVRDTLFPDAWMVKIDMEDAYNHLWVDDISAALLGICFDGKIYRWRSMGFGLKWAPYLFTKVVRESLRELRLRGVEILDYLDDLIIIAKSKLECQWMMNATIHHLTALGWRINWTKSHLIPTQQLEWIGFLWDTTTMKVSIPEPKLRTIVTTTKKMARRTIVSCRDLAKWLGHVASIGAVCKQQALFCRESHALLRRMRRTLGWSEKGPLSTAARQEMKLWARSLESWNAADIKTPEIKLHVQADASQSGWGAANLTTGEIIGGFWRAPVRFQHITRKETMAGIFAVRAFAPQMEDGTLLLDTDNICCRRYLNRLQGGRLPHLFRPCRRLFKLLQQRRITLKVRYIRGKDNIIADWASRIPRDRNDWAVRMDFLRMVWRKLRVHPTLDCFATATNRRCDRFISRTTQPWAWGVDFFAIPARLLRKFRLWANPPWPLMALLLDHIRRYRLRITVCLPIWTTLRWWPLALRLMESEVVLIPPRVNLYEDCWGRVYPGPRWWTCIATLSSDNLSHGGVRAMRPRKHLLLAEKRASSLVLVESPHSPVPAFLGMEDWDV